MILALVKTTFKYYNIEISFKIKIFINKSHCIAVNTGFRLEILAIKWQTFLSNIGKVQKPVCCDIIANTIANIANTNKVDPIIFCYWGISFLKRSLEPLYPARMPLIRQ